MKIVLKEEELAGKITGMLLEMEDSEVMALIDSDEALDAKVREAVNVLNEYSTKDETAGTTAPVAVA